MTVNVYHREYNESDNISFYKLVAKINVTVEELKSKDFMSGGDNENDVNPYLNYAWRYTNNILGSWSKNDGEYNPDFSPFVEVLGEYPIGRDGKEYGLRSSMVGDIFEIDGKEWIVAPVGFKMLEQPQTNLKTSKTEEEFVSETLGFNL